MRLRELSRQHGRASGAQQETLRGQMVEVTGQLFELKQAERRARLEELSTRIQELQSEIDQREKDRKQVIDAYVEELLKSGPSL